MGGGAAQHSRYRVPQQWSWDRGPGPRSTPSGIGGHGRAAQAFGAFLITSLPFSFRGLLFCVPRAVPGTGHWRTGGKPPSHPEVRVPAGDASSFIQQAPSARGWQAAVQGGYVLTTSTCVSQAETCRRREGQRPPWAGAEPLSGSGGRRARGRQSIAFTRWENCRGSRGEAQRGGQEGDGPRQSPGACSQRSEDRAPSGALHGTDCRVRGRRGQFRYQVPQAAHVAGRAREKPADSWCQVKVTGPAESALGVQREGHGKTRGLLD